MGGGKCGMTEKIRRFVRTLHFLIMMVASLLIPWLPVLVAIGDILVPCLLLSSFVCVRCYSFQEHLNRYDFRSSLTDVPVVSAIRSVIIVCVYMMYDGQYLGTVTLCSIISILVLSFKACVFTVNSHFEAECSSSLSKQKLHLKISWGMNVLFLSSVAFALGHTVVAYRTSCRARRKLMFNRVDPDSVDMLIYFCKQMGFSSVVLVGHDDGGLLALKAAQRVQSSTNPVDVKIKGVVLLTVCLSREVVPGLARILMRTTFAKKNLVHSLLRTEIGQVVNRRAWYDATKLTTNVLSLYKAPLYVEGWDESLYEIGKLSSNTVLTEENASSLVKAVEDTPVMVIAGAEDALVSLNLFKPWHLNL